MTEHDLTESQLVGSRIRDARINRRTVSYTHLDVYKRQGVKDELWRQRLGRLS